MTKREDIQQMIRRFCQPKDMRAWMRSPNRFDPKPQYDKLREFIAEVQGENVAAQDVVPQRERQPGEDDE